MSEIKVSINCLTFNHEPFIRECLEGFVNQKTNFAFEVNIHDDASTDKTADIIMEYQKKYPDIIKPLIQTENQYSQGVHINRDINFLRANGEYIAMCEGDDYWIDPYKLQKQIDFLDNNPAVGISMSLVRKYIQKSGKFLDKMEKVPYHSDGIYTTIDYLKFPFSQTSSFVFRNKAYNFPEWSRKVHAGDKTLVVLTTGNIKKIKLHFEYFSVYRVHGSSITYRAKYDIFKKSLETHDYWHEYLGNGFPKLFIFLKFRIRMYEKASINKINNLLLKVPIIVLNRIIRYTNK
ncbi:MAG: glycosyltransferase family 2 protein [Flavobacteriales bacterium]